MTAAQPLMGWPLAALRSASRHTTQAGLPDRPRRLLTRALGLLWLLDAALQFQPYMFTQAFPTDTLQPSGVGSPSWVQGPVSWSAHLMAGHIIAWNGAFAVIQLAIALGLFFDRTRKLALAASIAWSLSVWWLGEGLGGLLAGPVSPLAGLPGAVLLYALIAVLVWPRSEPRPSGVSVAEASPLGRVGARLVWLALWALFAVEAVLPANRAPHALGARISAAAGGEPGWVKRIDGLGAGLVGARGTEFSWGLAVACALIGLGVLVPALRRPALVLAVLTALALWVVGEDFGAIATGSATDPNSGLPLAILALGYWPNRRPTQRCGPNPGRAGAVPPDHAPMTRPRDVVGRILTATKREGKLWAAT